MTRVQNSKMIRGLRFDSIRFGSIRFDSVRFGSMQLHCVSEEHLRSIRKTNPLSLADPKLFYFVISKTAMSSSILKPFLPFVLFSKTNTCFSPIIIFLNSRRVPLINISHLISEITKTQIFNQLIFHLPIKRNLSANELNREPVFVSFVNFLIYLLMKFLFSQFRPIPSYFALFAKLAFPLLVKFLQGATLFVASHVFWSKFNPSHRLASSGRFTTTKGGEREGGGRKKLATAYKEILKLTPPSSLPTKFTNYF